MKVSMTTTPQCYFASPCFCTTCIQNLALKFCYKRSKVFEETQSNLPSISWSVRLKFCYKRSKVFEETQSNLPSISWSVRRFGFDLVTNG